LFDRQADDRHARLFDQGRPSFPRSPSGWRAEDVLGDPEDEGFVSIKEAARRMNIDQDAVLRLARSGYLLGRWCRGRLLVRPGIL
jgi:hypothetical protein